jgi:uracil-DNA glycosylase family 4
MSQSDAEKILSNAQAFLRQQQELYGDLFLTPPERTADQSESPEMKSKKSSSVTGPITIPVSDPGQPQPAISNEPWAAATDLRELNEQICNCQKCGLGNTRKSFVFGVGNPRADIVVIGEAPGADEDEKGEPFVGRAGQLLTKILEAIQFKREDVYICNMLKCRPPNNRDPLPEEIEHCEPYLWKQLEIIKPKMILCVGRIAGQSILKTKATLTELRGNVHQYRGIPLMVTFHPAALLRNPNWKQPCWDDVQKFRKMYDEMTKKS